MTLGRDEVGWSCPASAPTHHGWSLNQCPVLLDSGACVPMRFLLSLKALELACPGVDIMPVDQNSPTALSAASGSLLQLIGSIDLHFWFSGPSVVSNQDGKWAMSGPVM